MATQYAFGKIVTNGLVLALDAADKNSYPGSGTTWRDVSGNNYAATLVNNPSFSTNSITLDGTDDYITISHGGNLSFSSGNFSVCVWNRDIANPTSLYGGIITNDNTGDNAWKIFKDVNEGSYKARCGANFASFATFTVGRWHYYAYTVNVSTGIMSLYLDAVAGNTAAGTLSPTSQNNIAFGSYRYNDAVSGFYLHNQSIGPTQLYNRVLTASEILQNYNAQKSRFGL